MRGHRYLTIAGFVVAVEGEKNFDARRALPDLWYTATLSRVAARDQLRLRRSPRSVPQREGSGTRPGEIVAHARPEVRQTTS
jgi:hypothetical protein